MTVTVRQTTPQDFPGIIALSRAVYPDSIPWNEEQLGSHLRMFPEGQFVAVDDGGEVVGMAASLIVLWDDYAMHTPWRDFTAHGTFVNHDARGHTLYGAEIMVAPGRQSEGIGTQIYAARRELVERLGLLRIRAGARLRGYHRFAERMSAEDYALEVARGRIFDPTVTFQLRRGFRVLGVVPNYLRKDPESLGWAAIIEWLNPAIAKPEDEGLGDPRFQVPFEEPPRGRS